MSIFSERLRERRYFLRLTQEKLAEQAGTRANTIARYENERFTSPKRDTLERLARALNTTTSYLLGETDDPEPRPMVTRVDASGANVGNVGNNGTARDVAMNMKGNTLSECNVPWWANLMPQAYQMIATGNQRDIEAALGAINMTKSILEGAIPKSPTNTGKTTDVDTRDQYGKTPLMRAAENNPSGGVIEAFILTGADVNARDNDSWTPLMWAAWNNDSTEVVKTLIKYGADVNAREKESKTVLMRAAENNPSSEVIKTLIQAGADVNAQDKNGWTALMWAACGNKSPEVIKALIEQGADITVKDSNNNSVISLAKRKGYYQNVDVLEKAAEQ